ncbi:MAG: hypothetical protein WA672_13985 [Candidatus Angelobacter sp.]
MLEELRKQGFEIQLESHAAAILEQDFPTALADIEKVLTAVRIPIREIIGSGGGETKVRETFWVISFAMSPISFWSRSICMSVTWIAMGGNSFL